MEDFEYMFKIVVIGDTDVGKTSLMHRYTEDKFMENTTNTIGVDHFQIIKYIDEKKIKINIWDTAGQERFRTMTNAYYKDAHGTILVYDVTDRETFVNLVYWMKEVERHCKESVQKVVLGNKSDLEKEDWQISEQEAGNFAERKKSLFGVVSAKEDKDKQVTQIMELMIKKILQENQKNAEFEASQRDHRRKSKVWIEEVLKTQQEHKESDGKCCG